MLGIHFDEELKGREDWEMVGQKITQKFNLWRLRELSFTSKVLIVKSVILPVILYVALVFPPSSKLNRALFIFLWG